MRIIITVILIFIPILGFANKGSALFKSSEPIDLILQMDMQKVLDEKAEPEYSNAQLLHCLNDNQMTFFDIKVKARGNTRRIGNICEFPPLKINFAKKSTKNTIFDGQDKLKLVTHCQESDAYQNYTLLEYLSYKTYNTITDYSYKVRLVNITYKDISQTYPDIQKTGFIIEDDDLLAKRIGGTITNKKIWSPDSCNQNAVDVFSLFQFMIGNTDWWIHTRHNVDIIVQDDNLIPVPFDFDYAGIINTPYAVPSKQLPIQRVTDRFFKGSCKTATYYDGVVELYNQKKSRILAVIENATYLNKNSRKISIKYVERFYKIINDPNKFSDYLNSACDLIQ